MTLDLTFSSLHAASAKFAISLCITLLAELHRLKLHVFISIMVLITLTSSLSLLYPFIHDQYDDDR